MSCLILCWCHFDVHMWSLLPLVSLGYLAVSWWLGLIDHIWTVLPFTGQSMVSLAEGDNIIWYSCRYHVDFMWILMDFVCHIDIFMIYLIYFIYTLMIFDVHMCSLFPVVPRSVFPLSGQSMDHPDSVQPWSCRHHADTGQSSASEAWCHWPKCNACRICLLLHCHAKSRNAWCSLKRQLKTFDKDGPVARIWKGCGK